jgi:hypothetical protein
MDRDNFAGPALRGSNRQSSSAPSTGSEGQVHQKVIVNLDRNIEMQAGADYCLVVCSKNVAFETITSRSSSTKMVCVAVIAVKIPL